MGRTFYQGNPVNCLLTATPTLRPISGSNKIGFRPTLGLFLSSHIIIKKREKDGSP